MQESIISERIQDFREIGIPEYTLRDLKVSIVPNMILTITGARKVGKTYFTYQIIESLISSGFIKSLEDVCYLHFDDETLVSMKASDLTIVDKSFLKIKNQQGNKHQNALFVFDEIHKIKGWENFVLRLQKRPGWQVIVTGSSADIEEDKIGRELRGKSLTSHLLPFSFREYLRHINKEPNSTAYSSSKSSELRTLFKQYLSVGSYPAVAGLEPLFHRNLLQNYFNSIVAADFIYDKNISTPVACKLFLKELMHKNSSQYTHKKTRGIIKSYSHRISATTISNWFEWAVNSYLIGALTIDANSRKKQEQNYRKTYAVDWHLANTNSVFVGDRNTKDFEAAIYWELRRRGYSLNYQLTKSRKNEIDFVARENNLKPIALIQASYSLNSPNTLERELSALRELSKEDAYQNFESKLLITNDLITDPSSIAECRKNGIEIKEAWKWFLD